MAENRQTRKRTRHEAYEINKLRMMTESQKRRKEARAEKLRMRGAEGYTLIELMIAIGLIGFIGIPLAMLVALWTDRNLDFWLTMYKHHAVHINYWLAFALTVVCNGFILLANIVGEILRHCI